METEIDLEEIEKQTQILAERQTQILNDVSGQRDTISSDRMDISFGELINLYQNKELIIQPEYQRTFRWSIAQKTALIESLLLTIPIPPIFVVEDENGIWELVDGLQRVSTFISFFGKLKSDVSKIKYKCLDDEAQDEVDDVENDTLCECVIGNKWALESGRLLDNLKGFTIDTLPQKLILNLKRTVCRVEILRGETRRNMRYELFKRLNSGGSKLTPQEIRNAIYRESNSKMNNLILKLSELPEFIALTNLSDKKISELYNQELVLRIFAFYESVNEINENTENVLNDFMENYEKKEGFDFDKYESFFKGTLCLIHSIGDLAVFKNTGNSFVPAYFEGIILGVAQNIALYEDNIELLKEKIKLLKTDDEFKKASGSASNSRTRIRKRLQRSNTIFSESE